MHRREGYDLYDAITELPWLRIPYDCIRECGPASQTFAGVVRMSRGGQTFASAAKIATAAGVPYNTAKKHLATLTDAGWIKNEGRDHRRTVTITLPKRGGDDQQFGVLPLFCTNEINGVKLRWASRVLFAVVCATVRKIASIDGVESLCDLNDHDYRFRFSVRSIRETTGLNANAIVEAKRQITRTGLVSWRGQPDGCDQTGHVLFLSHEMRVVEHETSNGMTYAARVHEHHAA